MSLLHNDVFSHTYIMHSDVISLNLTLWVGLRVCVNCLTQVFKNIVA